MSPIPTLRTERYVQLRRPAIAAIAACFIALSATGGQSEPPGTIKLVVPYAPGSASDILARLLAEQIGRARAATMVIENRPGAGAVIGTEVVARAVPDGNTLLINANSFVINPHLRKLAYDPLVSFEPICYLVNSPTILVVNGASPYRSLSDLLNAARAKPGVLTLAAVGPGSPFQIGLEMLKRMAGVNITYVPYPGSAPAVTALLGGHVSSVLAAYPNVAEELRTGRLRALATTTPTRIDPLPEVPTIAESGFKGFEVDNWFGVVAPARTPQEKVVQLSSWFTAAMQSPETRPRLVAQGLYPTSICGAEFAAILRRQYDEYGRVIREANIKAE